MTAKLREVGLVVSIELVGLEVNDTQMEFDSFSVSGAKGKKDEAVAIAFIMVLSNEAKVRYYCFC